MILTTAYVRVMIDVLLCFIMHGWSMQALYYYVSLCMDEVCKHVSEHWQQSKCQSNANCFILWMPIKNLGPLTRETNIRHPILTLTLTLSPSLSLTFSHSLTPSHSRLLSLPLSPSLALSHCLYIHVYIYIYIIYSLHMSWNVFIRVEKYADGPKLCQLFK